MTLNKEAFSRARVLAVVAMDVALLLCALVLRQLSLMGMDYLVPEEGRNFVISMLGIILDFGLLLAIVTFVVYDFAALVRSKHRSFRGS